MTVEEVNNEEHIDNNAVIVENVIPETAQEEIKEIVIPVTAEKEEEVITKEEEKPVIEAKVELKKEEEVKVEPTLNDELVLSYLKKEKGFNAESFEDLKPKELKKFNAVAEKFQEFIEKTNNENIQDFLETQKDWTKEDDNVKLRQLLKIQNPKLSDSLLEHLFEESYVYDEEDDDEKTIKNKQIRIIQDVEKAEKLLEDRKKEFEVKRGSDDLIPEDYKKAKLLVDELKENNSKFQLAQEAVLKSYKEKAESIFTNEFKGFKQEVGNDAIGKFEITIKPENNQTAKEWHSDPQNLNSKFFDDNGTIINDDYYTIAEIARVGKDKYLNDFANTVIAEYIKKDAIASKNISDGMKVQPPATRSDFKVEKA